MSYQNKISETKYFIALLTDDKPTYFLCNRVWIGAEFIEIDPNTDLFVRLGQTISNFSTNEDTMIFFESLEKAYQYIHSEKFNVVLKKHNFTYNSIDWCIMNTVTTLVSHATKKDNNIDQSIALKALENIKSELTPEQMAILKQSL